MLLRSSACVTAALFVLGTALLPSPATAAGRLGKCKLLTGLPPAWTDSDGVRPGVEGCHYPFTDVPVNGMGGCQNAGAAADIFGEYCEKQPGADAGGGLNFCGPAAANADNPDVLIESNPQKNKCHDHPGNAGKPYRYSCDAWCKGLGSASGKCTVIANHCGVNKDSARCECTPPAVPAVSLAGLLIMPASLLAAGALGLRRPRGWRRGPRMMSPSRITSPSTIS